MLVVLGVAALAFASLAFATGGQGMARNWQGDGNTTGCGMMRGGAGDGNGTFAHAMNKTGMPRFNSTEQKAFEAAVESGDFAAATKLHGEYGFGGPLLGKLNETTFAKYSQIANLESQLETELGLNATGMMPPMQGKLGFGMRPGMQGGRGMMAPEFAKGMRQGNKQTTNQTTQQ